jgi:uncharacterized Zn-binding protein involved in type VI secretion
MTVLSALTPAASVSLADQFYGLSGANSRVYTLDQIRADVFWCGTAGGTANALTLTPTITIAAYAAGQVFSFIAASANTSATVTVNVAGLGVKSITGLAIGQIQAGASYQVTYNGTAFSLLALAGQNTALQSLGFLTRAEAEALNNTASITVLGCYQGGVLCLYEKDASGTALTTADGQDWSPMGGNATPAHWANGLNGYANDATTAVQACFTWVGTQYDSNLGTFDAWVNFAGQVWRCTGSIDSTNVRQPQMRFGNGALFFDMTGGYGLEMWGLNSGVMVEPFYIETPTDPDACPEAAFVFGRCESSGTAAPIAPSMKGKIFIDGCCSKASMINLGCEVSAVTAYVTNKHPDGDAFCYFGSGDMQDALDIWGAELSSSFCTLPPAASGPFSNILHDLGSSEFKRASLWFGNITGITKADPAVVAFTCTAANAALMANGQTVYIADAGGMDELEQRSFSVAGLTLAGDNLSGTMQLSGEDSGGHTAYSTGGRVWRATGDAVCSGVSGGIRIGPAGYALSYGGSAFRLHCRNGPINRFDFSGQTENQIANPINIDIGSSTVAIQGMSIAMMGAAQKMTAPFKITGAGTVSIRDLDLTVSTHAAAFADGLCTNGANFSIRTARIRVPNALDVTGLAAFAGTVSVQSPQTHRLYSSKSAYIELSNGTFKITGDTIATTGSYAQANFEAQADPVNATNKTAGCWRWDTTSSRVVYAAGANASAVWKFLDETTAYTPAP